MSDFHLRQIWLPGSITSLMIPLINIRNRLQLWTTALGPICCRGHPGKMSTHEQAAQGGSRPIKSEKYLNILHLVNLFFAVFYFPTTKKASNGVFDSHTRTPTHTYNRNIYIFIYTFIYAYIRVYRQFWFLFKMALILKLHQRVLISFSHVIWR